MTGKGDLHKMWIQLTAKTQIAMLYLKETHFFLSKRKLFSYKM